MITARQLARAYDLSVASLWRGETADNSLLTWLGTFRLAEALSEPQAPPEAVSLLGGGSSGIRWYSTPTAVLGFASGQPTVCYRIPIDTNLPSPRGSAGRETIVPADLVAATTL
jgi:hypothetical protein